MNIAIGTPCLFSFTDYHIRWNTSTIKRVHPDGTYSVGHEPLSNMHGVCQDEISFAEERLKPIVFDYIFSIWPTLNQKSFFELLNTICNSCNISLEREGANATWTSLLNNLELSPDTEFNRNSPHLDAFLSMLQFSHKLLMQVFKLEGYSLPTYRKTYWNDIRMGGRDPKEFPVVVTKEILFHTLGILAHTVDEKQFSSIVQKEREFNLVLSQELKDLFSVSEITEKLFRLHPNNPIPVKIENWETSVQADGKLLLSFLQPYSHKDFEWAIALDESPARVYRINHYKENYELVADTFYSFWWDLAQTGLGWYLETKNNDLDASIGVGGKGYFIEKWNG